MYDQSNELFEILKYSGKSTGRCKPRSEVHRDGDWHGCVHIWVFCGENVLLQKRSAEKDVFPNCIDASCTGHMDPGETPVAAALRELHEELGIRADASDLLPIRRRHVITHIPPLYNREIAHIFLLKPSVDRNALRYQEEEIDSLLLMTPGDLSDVLREKNPAYCIIPAEWKQIRKIRAAGGAHAGLRTFFIKRF